MRARSTETVKRGVGLASQVWWGGGGPPSYAWVRVGSDGHAAVVTATQDVGTGTKTALSQIAAEELGSRSPTSPSRSATPRADPTRRSRPGPRRCRRWARRSAPRPPTPGARSSSWPRSATGTTSGRGLAPSSVEEVLGLLGNGQILGTGARGPNPAGMQVLTFGVQVAEVAVDVETGEVTVERVAAMHDVGRVVNPLGASSQVEGGIIQGVGHTLSEERLSTPAPAGFSRVRSTPTGCRRSPTCPRS